MRAPDTQAAATLHRTAFPSPSTTAKETGLRLPLHLGGANLTLRRATESPAHLVTSPLRVVGANVGDLAVVDLVPRLVCTR